MSKMCTNNCDRQSILKSYYGFISGGAGVGKSYLTKLIICYIGKNFPLVPGYSPICAPTGTAARNMHGQTIHSKIPVMQYLDYEGLHPQSLNNLRITFSGVSTIIIDEISMVSSAMLTFISRRLNEITDNDAPFGGLSLIAVGDLFQLRPVKGSFIFKNEILVRFIHTNLSH